MPESLDQRWLAEVSFGRETESEVASIPQCTHTSRPLGTQEFVHALEESMDRDWFHRRAAGQLNRARIQDNQILISPYDEILKRGVLSQLLNDC